MIPVYFLFKEFIDWMLNSSKHIKKITWCHFPPSLNIGGFWVPLINVLFISFLSLNRNLQWLHPSFPMSVSPLFIDFLGSVGEGGRCYAFPSPRLRGKGLTISCLCPLQTRSTCRQVDVALACHLVSSCWQEVPQLVRVPVTANYMLNDLCWHEQARQNVLCLWWWDLAVINSPAWTLTFRQKRTALNWSSGGDWSLQQPDGRSTEVAFSELLLSEFKSEHNVHEWEFIYFLQNLLCSSNFQVALFSSLLQKQYVGKSIKQIIQILY